MTSRLEKRAKIAEALRANPNLSNAAIARQLRADRHLVGDIRRALGLPRAPLQPLTLEEKWEKYTRPVDGGHLEWTGERQRTSGTPVMRYREQIHTAARIAFRIRYGRDPQGHTFADCGMRHCVAPDHVQDEPGRIRLREQLRYLTGKKARPGKCRHGHDQAVHGRYETDGRSYCEACKASAKRGPQAVAL
jgi:hypothetical protein